MKFLKAAVVRSRTGEAAVDARGVSGERQIPLICARVHRCSGIAERSARARRGAERQKPPPRFLLIYERKLTQSEGERCRWREEVFIDSPEPGPSRRPWRDLAQFELYQGLRLINTLSEKELITKAE